MFSGIVEQVGVVVATAPRGGGRALTIRSPLPVAPAGQAGVGTADRERVGLGDSICVSGACLTVDAVHPPDTFEVTAGRETLARTALGAAGPGTRLHLERALRVGDRLDGHLVTGHVDGVGTVRRLRRAEETVVVEIEAPPELARFLAEKGSVCVSGVSLTVNSVAGSTFRVGVVPYTADETLLGGLAAGDAVNLEADLLARYVARLLEAAPEPGRDTGLTRARLAALGFLGDRRG